MDTLIQLPHDLEAERVTLGVALLEPGLVPHVVENLTVADFFSVSNQAIFRAIKNLFATHTDINPVSVADEVRRLDAQNGPSGATPAYIGQTFDGVPRFSRPESIKTYMDVIRKTSLQRRLVKYAEHLRVRAMQDDAEPTRLLEDMATKALEYGTDASLVSDLVSSEDAVNRTLAILEENWAKKGQLGLPSGFPELDRALLGFRGGRVYVVAAGPNIGKTTLVLNFVNNILKARPQATGLIVSMEMPVDQLAVKFLSIQTHVETQRIELGDDLTREELGSITQAAKNLSQLNLTYLEGFSEVTPTAISAKLSRIRAKYGHVDFLVLDYLQLLDADGGGGADYASITAISRALKRMAVKFNIPVLCVSQLSRKHSDRAIRDYQLSDLRGSGSIEQDADAVLFVMPKDWQNETDPERRLVIAKNRGGPKEISIPLLFFGHQARYESISYMAFAK